MELFRTLLMQRVEFFDRHATPELTALLSSDLDSLRSFIFSNVSRDRGLRAIFEAIGSVLVSASSNMLYNFNALNLKGRHSDTPLLQ